MSTTWDHVDHAVTRQLLTDGVLSRNVLEQAVSKMEEALGVVETSADDQFAESLDTELFDKAEQALMRGNYHEVASYVRAFWEQMRGFVPRREDARQPQEPEMCSPQSVQSVVLRIDEAAMDLIMSRPDMAGQWPLALHHAILWGRPPHVTVDVMLNRGLPEIRAEHRREPGGEAYVSPRMTWMRTAKRFGFCW